MTEYNIHLLHTVIHKFTGMQIRSGSVAQVFAQGETIPEENLVDISIQSTLLSTEEGRFLQSHFQVDDIRLPEDEQELGYRLQFCLFAIFEVGLNESPETIRRFSETILPNILAPLVSDSHGRFVSTLLPGETIVRLQPHIPAKVLQEFIKLKQVTFDTTPNSLLQN